MVDTPGRCRNLDYCSIGQMRTVVQVPVGQPFVCPECGAPLRGVVLLNAPLSRQRLALWSVGTLGIFVLLYECIAPSGQHARLPAAEQAPTRAATYGATLAAAPMPPAPAAPPSPETSPSPSAAISAATPAATLATTPPTTAPGARVRMECTIDAAGVPTNCTAVGNDRPAEPSDASVPALVQNPVPTAPAGTPPHPADREVSNLPVEGGAPPYPFDYVKDRRKGEVAVDCIIDADGEPTRCKVRDIIGGRRFAEATVNWLNTGAVRFAPAIHDGVPVAEERHWHIAFSPR